MKLIKSILLAGLVTMAAYGAPAVKGRRLTLTRLPYATVYCEDNCSYREMPGGRNFSVATPQGQVKVAITNPWLLIQSPQHVVRVRQTDTVKGQEILVQLDLVSYRIYRRPGEVEWQFPDDHVFFRMYEGSLRDVVGGSGSLAIHRNTREDSYEVSSEAGASAYQVSGTKKQVKVKTVSGEPPVKHSYLLKGVSFSNGGVGVFIPLPGGKLVSALGPDSVRQITFAEPAAKSGEEYVPDNTPFAPAPEKPLEAGAPTRGILNAGKRDYSQDPLNLGVKKNQPSDQVSDPIGTKTKKNPKPDHTDPLRAVTPPGGSEDALRIKSFDPLAPSSSGNP